VPELLSVVLREYRRLMVLHHYRHVQEQRVERVAEVVGIPGVGCNGRERQPKRKRVES
jgi:hypothetical protein